MASDKAEQTEHTNDEGQDGNLYIEIDLILSLLVQTHVVIDSQWTKAEEVSARGLVLERQASRRLDLSLSRKSCWRTTPKIETRRPQAS